MYALCFKCGEIFPGILRLLGCDNQTVNPAGKQRVDFPDFSYRVPAGIAEQKIISLLFDDLLNSARDLREERVRDVGHHEPEYLRPVGHQRPRPAVWTIVQLG